MMPLKVSKASGEASRLLTMPDSDEVSAGLLCFDIGNVLIKLGTSMRAVGPVANIEALEQLYCRYGVGELESAVFFRELLRLSDWRGSVSELRECFVHQRILGVQPGVQELFDELKALSIPLALLSNTNAAHWGYLAGFSLLKDCRYKLLSFEQECAKPDEEIFRRLEVQSGFSGAQILFFDDLERNVAVARRLGWRAVHIKPENAVLQMREFLCQQRVL